MLTEMVCKYPKGFNPELRLRSLQKTTSGKHDLHSAGKLVKKPVYPCEAIKYWTEEPEETA